jgi:hypothetical protein
MFHLLKANSIPNFTIYLGNKSLVAALAANYDLINNLAEKSVTINEPFV